MSDSSLSPKALALRTKFADSFSDLVSKKNDLVLASSPEERKDLCNEIIEDLVSSLTYLLAVLFIDRRSVGAPGLLVRDGKEISDLHSLELIGIG